MLSSEFVAAEISISEMTPENALRLCRPFAKVTSTIHKHLVYSPQFFAEAEIVIARHHPSPQSSPQPSREAVHRMAFLIGTYATLLRGSSRRGKKELKAREQRLKSSNEEDAKSGMLQRFNGSTSRAQQSEMPVSALALCQPQSGNDPLEIVVSVVFDLDPAPFLSVMNSHMRRKLFL